MKNWKYVLLPIFIASIIACSDDDDTIAPPEPGPPEAASMGYFPLKTENTWTYKNQYDPDSGQTKNSTETMKVGSSSDSGYNLSSNAPAEDEGLMTGLFANGKLKKSDGKLLYNGALKLDPGLGDSLVISLPLQDVVVYDTLAQMDTQLFTVTDSTDEDVTFGDLGTFTLHFVFTLSTSQNQAQTSISVGEETYDQVISSNLDLTLSCHVQTGGSDLFTLIEEHHVLSSTNYYAKNVGLVKSTNRLEVPFAEIPPGIPGVPEFSDIMANTSQELSVYTLQ